MHTFLLSFITAVGAWLFLRMVGHERDRRVREIEVGNAATPTPAADASAKNQAAASNPTAPAASSVKH